MFVLSYEIQFFKLKYRYNPCDMKGRYIMKRVKAACITQTLHFLLKEDVDHDYAIRLVNEEVKKYKEHLEKNKVQYNILSEETQEDGSVMIEIKKQYNASPVGHYLD